VIARGFTLGQLALLAWQLREFSRASEVFGDGVVSVDLRQFTGDELRSHLARLNL
jgi:hypothetical protein